LARKDVAQAQALWASMKECFEDSESPLITLRLHALNGMIAHDRGQYAEADRMFSEVCPHLKERGLRPELWQAVRFRHWCGGHLRRPRRGVERAGHRGPVAGAADGRYPVPRRARRLPAEQMDRRGEGPGGGRR